MAQNSIVSIAARPYSAGETVSPAFLVPGGIARVNLAMTVTPPALIDPAKEIAFLLERQDPATLQWIGDWSWTWPYNQPDKNGNIGIQSGWVDVGPLAGRVCRFRMTLPESLSIAVSLASE